MTWPEKISRANRMCHGVMENDMLNAMLEPTLNLPQKSQNSPRTYLQYLIVVIPFYWFYCEISGLNSPPLPTVVQSLMPKIAVLEAQWCTSSASWKFSWSNLWRTQFLLWWFQSIKKMRLVSIVSEVSYHRTWRDSELSFGGWSWWRCM